VRRTKRSLLARRLRWPDRFDLAEALIEEAMRTSELDRLLPLCAATNLVLGYFARGNPQLAFESICRLRANLGETWQEYLPQCLQMRQTWLEGQVRNALGMREEAIGLLRKAREAFIRAGCGYEVCYTSVDLALTFATQRSVERFGQEAVQLLLRRLLRQGRLEVDVIRAVASRLCDIGRTPLRIFSQSPLAELQI
jgi:hypothetical protein